MAEKDFPDYIINTKKDRATGLRLPREVHRKINERAERNYRTFNSMAVALLTDALNEPEIKVLFLRTYRKLLDLEKEFKALASSLEKGGPKCPKEPRS